MNNSCAVVTGAASGLGKAIANALTKEGFYVVRYDVNSNVSGDVVKPWPLDAFPDNVDVLVNCAGVNEINWLEDVSEHEWDCVMDVNVKGIFMMTQRLLPKLRKSKGTVLNIVSNAAHIPMRCSAAYNASKGAALILTKQLARELSPDVTVFSISPNKLKGTSMSEWIDRRVVTTRRWTAEQAEAYQKASLLCGEETDVETLADFIRYLLSSKERHMYLTGCDIPYGN